MEIIKEYLGITKTKATALPNSTNVKSALITPENMKCQIQGD